VQQNQHALLADVTALTTEVGAAQADKLREALDDMTTALSGAAEANGPKPKFNARVQQLKDGLLEVVKLAPGVRGCVPATPRAIARCRTEYSAWAVRTLQATLEAN